MLRDPRPSRGFALPLFLNEQKTVTDEMLTRCVRLDQRISLYNYVGDLRDLSIAKKIEWMYYACLVARSSCDSFPELPGHHAKTLWKAAGYEDTSAPLYPTDQGEFECEVHCEDGSQYDAYLTVTHLITEENLKELTKEDYALFFPILPSRKPKADRIPVYEEDSG